jgi:DivIVA domain-containing protein
VDQESVDRIRSATFNTARRGYDRSEVDSYLQVLADWLDEGGAEPTHSEVVQRELDQVGHHTAGVLSAAGEAAGEIRSEAEAEAGELLENARIESNALRIEVDDYAERIRSEADEYAQAERGKADAYALDRREQAEAEAGRLGADAKAGAERTLAEGRTRREALESVISDLADRRDKLLDELEALAGSIAGTASRARGVSPGNGSEAASEAETTEAIPSE